MREGDWKLIGKTRDTSESGENRSVEMFLVHLGDDPGEKINRAKEHPEIVERLRQLHATYLD